MAVTLKMSLPWSHSLIYSYMSYHVHINLSKASLLTLSFFPTGSFIDASYTSWRVMLVHLG